MFKFVVVVVFSLLLSMVVKVSDTYAEQNMSTFAGARFVYNALRINGPADKFDDMDQTTSQFGFGLSAGLRQSFKYVSLRYELDYNFNMKTISYYHAIMLNFYLEGRIPGSPVVPYVMAGGGINMFDPPSPHLESGLAFNAGCGVLYYLNDKWALDFSFRYMQASIDFHVNEGYTPIKNHMFNFGFQYTY